MFSGTKINKKCAVLLWLTKSNVRCDLEEITDPLPLQNFYLHHIHCIKSPPCYISQLTIEIGHSAGELQMVGIENGINHQAAGLISYSFSQAMQRRVLLRNLLESHFLLPYSIILYIASDFGFIPSNGAGDI